MKIRTYKIYYRVWDWYNDKYLLAEPIQYTGKVHEWISANSDKLFVKAVTK